MSGLQSYITKNAAARCRVDLKQMRSKSTKKRSKPRLLCDFSPVVDWLLSAYDAHLVETGRLSPYALLYGGDLKLYGQRIVSFVRALRHVGVVPVFFVDGSPGADVEYFEAQFPRLRSRHERMLERCAAVHRVCEGTEDILQVRWQLGQDTLAEIAGCLLAEGISLEHCTRGTSAAILAYQCQHSAVLGVLATNTDFAIAAGSKLFPLSFFDLDDSLGIHSADICPNPATLVCEWSDPSTLCQALQLTDERHLIDVSILCGNQFTAHLNEIHDPCKVLGLTSNSFESVSGRIAELDPQQLSALDFDAAYCDAIARSFEFYGYPNDSGESDGLPTNVLQKIQNGDYVALKVEVKVSDSTIASIENGLYWRWPVLEPVSLGQLCFSDLTLPLRKKAYSVLGVGPVREHGRTSTKSFTTVVVETESECSVCVREWSVTRRLVALFLLITDLDADVHSNTFKDRVASVASELDDELLPLLPHVVLVCASLCFLCHLASQPGYHLDQHELQALLMTSLFCSASVSPHLIAEPPSSPALTVSMQFAHTLHQAQLLASTLCVKGALPLPSAVFYPMAFMPHYMASQAVMRDHQPSSTDHREAYHNYQWVLHTPTTSQLFEEISTNWKQPNLGHLLKCFAESSQYLQNHRAYLFPGSQLPPAYLQLSFDPREDDEHWGSENDDANDDDLIETEVTECSGEQLVVTPKSEHDWSEVWSSQDRQALEDFQYFSQDFGEGEGAEVGVAGEERESMPSEGWEELESVQGESGEVEGVRGDCEEVENVPSEGGEVGDNVEGKTGDEMECTLVDTEPQHTISPHLSSQSEKSSHIILPEVEGNTILCPTSPSPSPSPSSSSASSSYSYSYSSSQQETTPRPSSQLHVQSPRLYGTNLPIGAHRRKLLELIEENRVVCVEGETGCGKSTRVPQYILDHARSLSPPRDCRVLVTQPRRMAAIKLAERVAAERRERLGHTVGYCVGGDHSTTSGVAITYCTTGYLLQALVHNPDMVERYTHIILDEIHERSTDADFTLLVVRELLLSRGPNAKLVIMSATMQGSLVVNYLKHHFSSVAGPYFVGVKHYGVDTYFLDELDKIPPNQCFWDESQLKAAAALKQLAEDRPVESLRAARTARPCVSAYCQQVCTQVVISQAHLGESILIFLPGYNEIAHYFEYLQNEIKARRVSNHFRIFVLHSQVPLEDQKDAFVDPPPSLAHVILATNIAESSITLPKLRVVINFGIYRRLQYDNKRHISCLVKNWCSRASCEQRAGRAGRVFVGTVVHLFTRRFHDTVLSPYDTPEILTAPIAKIVLQAKCIGKMIGCPRPSAFLSRAIEPPSLQQMEAALQDLARLGAIESCPGKEIDEEADITFFGNFSLSLPVDLDLSRVVLYGLLFGCAADAIVIAAAMSLSQDVLSLPTRVVMKDEKEFRESLERSYRHRSSFDAESYSDAIVVRNLFKKWLSYRTEEGKMQKYSKYALARRFCGLHACRLERLLQLETITSEIAQKTIRHVPAGTAVYESLLKLMSLYNIQPSFVSSGRGNGESEVYEVEFCEDADVLRAMLAASFPHQLLYGVGQCESFNDQEKAASLGLLRLIEDSKVDVARTVVVSGGKNSSTAAVQSLLDIVLPDKFCQVASFGSTSLITLNHSFESSPLTSLLRNLKVIPLSTPPPTGHERKLVSTPLPTELILLWQFGERRPHWTAGDISVNFSRPEHPQAVSWFRLTKHKERVQILSWRNPTGLVCEVSPTHKPLPFMAVAGHLQGFGSRSYVSASNISLLPSLHASRNAFLIALAFQPLTSKPYVLVDHVNHRVVGMDINSFTLTEFPNGHYLDPQDLHNINSLRQVISEVFTSRFTSNHLSSHFLSEIPRLLSKLLSHGRQPKSVETEAKREFVPSCKWERFLVNKEVVVYRDEWSDSESEDEAADQEPEVVSSGYEYLPPSQCSILQHLPEDSSSPAETEEQSNDETSTSGTCSLPGASAVVDGGHRQAHSDTEVESKMTKFKLSPTAPEFVPTTTPDSEASVQQSDSSSCIHTITDHSEVMDPIPAVSAVSADLPLPLPTSSPMSPIPLSSFFKPQFLSHIAHLPVQQQHSIQEHLASLCKELLPKQSPTQSDPLNVLSIAHVDQPDKPDQYSQSVCPTGDLYGHSSSLLETPDVGTERKRKPHVPSSAASLAFMHPPQQFNLKGPPYSPVTVPQSTKILPTAGRPMGPVSTISQSPVSQRPATHLPPDHLRPFSRPKTNVLRFPYPYTTHPQTHPHPSQGIHGGRPIPTYTLSPTNPSLQPSLKPVVTEMIPCYTSSRPPPMPTRDPKPSVYFSKHARKPLSIQSELDLYSRAPGARLSSTGGHYQARYPATSSLPNPTIFGYVPSTSMAALPHSHCGGKTASPPKIFPSLTTHVPLHKASHHLPPSQAAPARLTAPTQYEAKLAEFIDGYLRKHGDWAELKTVISKYWIKEALPFNTSRTCDWLAVCKDRFTMCQSHNGIIIGLKKDTPTTTKTREGRLSSEERETEGTPERQVADPATTVVAPLVGGEDVIGEVDVKENSPAASPEQSLAGPASHKPSADIEHMKDTPTSDITADVQPTASEEVEPATEDRVDETADRLVQPSSEGANGDDERDSVIIGEESTHCAAIEWEESGVGSREEVELVTHHVMETEYDVDMNATSSTITAEGGDIGIEGSGATNDMPAGDIAPCSGDIVAECGETVTGDRTTARAAEGGQVVADDRHAAGSGEVGTKDGDIVADDRTTVHVAGGGEVGTKDDDIVADDRTTVHVAGGGEVGTKDDDIVADDRTTVHVAGGGEAGTKHDDIVADDRTTVHVAGGGEAGTKDDDIVADDRTTVHVAGGGEAGTKDDDIVADDRTTVHVAGGGEAGTKDGDIVADDRTTVHVAGGGEVGTKDGDIVADDRTTVHVAGGGEAGTKDGDIVADDRATVHVAGGGEVGTKDGDIVADDRTTVHVAGGGEAGTKDGDIVADDRTTVHVAGGGEAGTKDGDIVADDRATVHVAGGGEVGTKDGDIVADDRTTVHVAGGGEAGTKDGDIVAENGDVVASDSNIEANCDDFVTGDSNIVHVADVYTDTNGTESKAEEFKCENTSAEKAPGSNIGPLSDAPQPEVVEDDTSPPAPTAEECGVGVGEENTGDGDIITETVEEHAEIEIELPSEIETGEPSHGVEENTTPQPEVMSVGEVSGHLSSTADNGQGGGAGEQGGDYAEEKEEMQGSGGPSEASGDREVSLHPSTYDSTAWDTSGQLGSSELTTSAATEDGAAISSSIQQLESGSKSGSMDNIIYSTDVGDSTHSKQSSDTTVDFFVACLKLVKDHSHIWKLSILYRRAHKVKTYIDGGFFASHPNVFHANVHCIGLASETSLMEAGVQAVELDPHIAQFMIDGVDYCPSLGYNIGGGVRIDDSRETEPERRRHVKAERKMSLGSSTRDRNEREGSQVKDKPHRRRSFHSSSRRRVQSPHFPKDVRSQKEPGNITHILKYYKKFFATRTEPILYSDLLSQYILDNGLPSDFYLPSDLLKPHFDVYWEGGKRYIRPFPKTKKEKASEVVPSRRKVTRGCKSEESAVGLGPTVEENGKKSENGKRKTKGPKRVKKTSTRDTSLKGKASSPSTVELEGAVVDPPTKN